MTRAEAGTGAFDPLQDMEQILQAARQSVELPDDDDIAVAELADHLQKLRPIPAPAGGSSNMRLQPAASSARRWAAVDWSSPFDTRA
jgi:hypothetical protein